MITQIKTPEMCKKVFRHQTNSHWWHRLSLSCQLAFQASSWASGYSRWWQRAFRCLACSQQPGSLDCSGQREEPSQFGFWRFELVHDGFDRNFGLSKLNGNPFFLSWKGFSWSLTHDGQMQSEYCSHFISGAKITFSLPSIKFCLQHPNT